MQAKEMKILNRRGIEEIERIVERNYGAKLNLDCYVVLIVGVEKKIWLASREILKIELEKLSINSIGFYFGKLKRNDKIHLSTEGSQIVGRFAKKNIVELGEESAENFMKGMDVKNMSRIDCEPHNFVLVRSGKDFLGCSLLTENELQNLLPKSRRILT